MGMESSNSEPLLNPQEREIQGIDKLENQDVANSMAETAGAATQEPEQEKRFESSRDYSKEINPYERRRVAEAIRRQRREYFSKQEETRNKLEEIISAAESKKLSAEETRRKIEETEREIEESSRNFVRRLLDRNKLKQLEAQLGIAKTTEETIQEELAELETAKLDVEKSLEDRSALDKARDELDRFYQKTERSWNEYEENRFAGNVRNIMRDRNAFLVHTFINPTFSPSDENGLMRKELSWKDKLDLLVLEPTLSASAVDKNHDKTFAPVGVLLADGQVQTASSGDIGSRSLGLKGRTLRNTYDNPKIAVQIDNALNPENKRGWTEFVVSEPKVAGLFFKVEDDGTLSDLTFGSDATMQDIVSFAQERQMPLFVMRSGEFYSITAEEALVLAEPIKTETEERIGLNTYKRTQIEHRKLDLLEEKLLTGEEASKLPECIDEAQKEAILERLMTDSPFQLRRLPEALQTASRAEGRSLYHLYANLDSSETDNKENAVIPRNAAGNVDPMEVTILNTVSGPTHFQHLVKLEDGTRAIWYQSRKPVSDESRFRAGSLYRQDWLLTKESAVNIGQSYLRTEKTPEGIAEIIEATKKEIASAIKWIQKWEKDGADFYAEQNRNRLKNIFFSLYGIAEEARSVGDNATVELVQQVIGEYLSEEEYNSVISRRISESGTFMLTREELTGK